MGDALDFLVKGKVDIASVEEYLDGMGYTPKGLTQPYRHVVGKVDMSGKDFFFKMASRPQLSVYIENEFAWLKMVEKEGLDKEWRLRIPRVYKLGRKGNLSWWIGEYISGVSADDDSSFLGDALEPTAQIVKNIMEIKLPHKMPLDVENVRSTIVEKLDAYENRVSRDISHLLAFLNENKDWVQIAPARGDIGAGSFITAFKKTPDFQSGDELNADMPSSFRGNPAFQSGEDVIKGEDKKIWFIDWEYATRTNIKFYDVSYFQYRLFVNVGKADWAEEYMKAFRNIYKFNKKDERALHWMNVYRLVGGYNEADKRPELFERVKEWEKLVMQAVSILTRG